MLIALVGNQNCGKTTLFNRLTGSAQHTGNFPGVTVEYHKGILRGLADTVLMDLPGVYSLTPYSAEEAVTRMPFPRCRESSTLQMPPICPEICI